MRSTLQRTFAVLQGALPRGGAVALRSAAIQQQHLAGAEHHGGGLCAAERRPPLPPLPCLRLPGQPDAARKGHCCVYRLPNQIKTKRSAPCTIQDLDRSDCQILIFIQLSGFASGIRFTKFCAAPAQGRRSRWAWTKSRSCRFPARCAGEQQFCGELPLIRFTSFSTFPPRGEGFCSEARCRFNFRKRLRCKNTTECTKNKRKIMEKHSCCQRANRV